MKKYHFLCLSFAFFMPFHTLANTTASVRETMLEKKRGFLTCAGGTQSPLFKQDCKVLTVERVSFGGNHTYEAQCKDSSGTVFTVACLAFSFEPDRSMSIPDTGFGP